MERETFTSTRLQLRVYTDSQCSQAYDDGQTARKHATRGYLIGDSLFETKVSFRPPFYSCLTCIPDDISGTFNKLSSNWYDDDYISAHGQKAAAEDYANNVNTTEEAQSDNNSSTTKSDDYYHDDVLDDQYLAANDDVKTNDYSNRDRKLLGISDQLQVRLFRIVVNLFNSVN
jgi:hypothetical protein